MQTIKPFTLGLQTRCIEYRRRIGMCVTASVYFPFAAEGQGTAWTDVSMWNFLGDQMPEGPFIDEGIVKTRPEFLVRGSAYAPQGSARACRVVARLGNVEKRLNVYGPRQWSGAAIGDPQPFAVIPLDWSRAYGGPSFPENPLGMGHDDLDVGGVRVRPLPQVELADQPLQRYGDVLSPAAFGPIDLMWPQRARYRGTYDDRWLKEQSPGFASDLDWRFFNLAPADQWFNAPLRGDEAFSFENMHPTKSVVGGSLPAFKARVFVQSGRPKTDPQLSEVPMRLTTVWFFPHAERGVMLFHGLAECEQDDGTDLTLLVGALERLSEPKADEHYLEAVKQRLDPKTRLLAALRDSDLLPAGLTGSDPDFEATQADYRPLGLMAQAQRNGALLAAQTARDEAIARGANPASIVVPLPSAFKPPTIEELPAFVAKQEKDALNAQVSALIDAAEQAQRAKADMAKLGVDPAALVHRGPPLFRAAGQLQRLQAQIPSSSPGAIDLKKLAPAFLKVEAMERDGYRRTAHEQAPAPKMNAQRAAATRAWVEDQHKQGKSFMGLDLTGADLGGMDLRNADFTGAWLESANLKGAILEGASFSYAVLAHADLTEVEASEAQFVGANLGKSVLVTARLAKAKLDGALLNDTALAQTDFRGASLDGADLRGATYGLADWRNVSARGLLFHKAVLKDMVLRGCRLQQPQFVECDLSAADFAGAELERPTFVGCKGHGAVFTRAHLVGAVFVDGCDLSQADFRAAQMPNTNMRGTVLRKARFDSADLSAGDYSECDLDGANLERVNAVGSLFIKALATHCRASSINLKDAILQRADLRGTSLAQANLFGADLSRIHCDDATHWDGSLTTRTKTYPRRPESAWPQSMS